MKRTLLAVIVLILIVAAVWAVANNHNKKKSAAGPVAPTADVDMNAKGFTPAALTVKTGTKVTWLNVDVKNDHRVKANPYPTGESLPGLDSKVNMPPHSTYTYTFSTAGTYKYHDQLNPLLNGEVVVTQ
jgi:plastocyanin